jgi:hypothetical protein
MGNEVEDFVSDMVMELGLQSMCATILRQCSVILRKCHGFKV